MSPESRCAGPVPQGFSKREMMENLGVSEEAAEELILYRRYVTERDQAIENDATEEFPDDFSAWRAER